jgi:glycosyltransferase involved in cell wall biosynthesis
MSDASELPSDRVPMVTVALAVLNGGPFLEYAVMSVLNQSWSDWELLLLDDGSTDGAIERLPFLFDPRIVVVRDGHNRGLASRLNQAVGMARGKYFARMDHDDVCHPERFARQVAFLDGNPEVDLLATQCLTIDEQERLIGKLPYANTHVDICRRPWQGFYMAHPSWMGKTKWFRRNAYQDPAPYCCEDQELLLRAHYSSCYHALPECLLAYRVRTHISWQKQFRTRVAMGKMQVHHFLNRGEWVNALLSVFMELARVGCDSWKKIRSKVTLSAKGGRNASLSTEDRQEWQAIITGLKFSAESSKSSSANNGNI